MIIPTAGWILARSYQLARFDVTNEFGVRLVGWAYIGPPESQSEGQK
jgi:hypothetical protein